jgi:hypothetical protein
MNDLWIELAMDEDETQKNGMILIIDLGGFPVRLFKFLSPKATIISALKEEVTLDCKLPKSDWVFHSLTHSLISYPLTLQPALRLIKHGTLLTTKLYK